MLYLAIKHLHVTCVILSITGFCLRGLLLARKCRLRRPTSQAAQYEGARTAGALSALAGRRWLRIVPHVNDAILLAAALALTALTGQYPFVDDWLTAKVFGLIAYIILGALALQPGRDARLRVAAGMGAVAVFGWIASVALARHPLGLFG